MSRRVNNLCTALSSTTVFLWSFLFKSKQSIFRFCKFSSAFFRKDFATCLFIVLLRFNSQRPVLESRWVTVNLFCVKFPRPQSRNSSSSSKISVIIPPKFQAHRVQFQLFISLYGYLMSSLVFYYLVEKIYLFDLDDDWFYNLETVEFC